MKNKKYLRLVAIVALFCAFWLTHHAGYEHGYATGLQHGKNLAASQARNKSMVVTHASPIFKSTSGVNSLPSVSVTSR